MALFGDKWHYLAISGTIWQWVALFGDRRHYLVVSGTFRQLVAYLAI